MYGQARTALAPGACDPSEVVDPDDGGLSAVGYAALCNHYDIFGLKKIKVPPDHPAARDVLRYSCGDGAFEVVRKLLAAGMNPNDKSNGGCSAIQYLLTQMDWEDRFRDRSWTFGPDLLDTERTRRYVQLIHLLAKHGAKWIPDDAYDVNSGAEHC